MAPRLWLLLNLVVSVIGFPLLGFCSFSGSALSLESSDPWVKEPRLPSSNATGWDKLVSLRPRGFGRVVVFASLAVGEGFAGAGLRLFLGSVTVLAYGVEEDEIDQMPHSDDALPHVGLAFVTRSGTALSQAGPAAALRVLLLLFICYVAAGVAWL